VSKKIEAIDVTEQVILENKFVDEKTLREIKTRRGQPEFRQSLLFAFEGKCCITNCCVESVLEAAHIIPHSEESNYSVLNGLLLRADIHTLYDLNLIGIDGNGKVFVSENLRESEYWQFQGKIIAENIPFEMSANLAKRFESFSQTGDFN
jgi:predicted restriction endonuclease